MLRISIARASGAALRARNFSTLRPLMAAGDTGSTRFGGEVQSDSFVKREKAQEEGWIKEEELKKLRALRDKLAKQKTHIEDLNKEIDEMLNEGGARR